MALDFTSTFDTDDLVSEIESDIERIAVGAARDIISEGNEYIRDIAREEAPDYLTRADLPDMDDYVTEYGFGDRVESLLDSFPADYNGRCNLGRSFTDAVYAVLADVLSGVECPNDTAAALRSDLESISGGDTRVTITATGAVAVVGVDTETAAARERFCVAQRDAYGKTAAIHGPFVNYADAVVWSEAHLGYIEMVSAQYGTWSANAIFTMGKV